MRLAVVAVESRKGRETQDFWQKSPFVAEGPCAIDVPRGTIIR